MWISSKFPANILILLYLLVHRVSDNRGIFGTIDFFFWTFTEICYYWFNCINSNSNCWNNIFNPSFFIPYFIFSSFILLKLIRKIPKFLIINYWSKVQKCANIQARKLDWILVLCMLQRICGTRYSPESLTRLENPGNPYNEYLVNLT